MPSLLSEVPRIEEHPQSCVVELGDDVTLFCRATGKNLQYRWFKSTKCLPNETLPSLYFSRVTLRDAGRYTCIVSNGKNTLLTWAIVDVVSVLHKNRVL